MRSASWRGQAGSLARLFVGVGAAAVATYVYLIVVAREVGPEAYASFSGFWAAVVIVGTGIYLPIEQETARRGVDVGRDGASRLRRAAIQAALVVTAGLAGALLAFWPLVAEFFGGDVLLALALVLGGLGYAVQYPTRGLLSAQRHYGWYASVLGSEAFLRIVLVAGLVIFAEPSAGVLALVVGAAALGSAVVGMVGVRSGELRAGGRPLPLLRSVAVLIAGSVALQSLLYGSVLVAQLWAPVQQEAAAGQLLAAIAVTRIPVFIFQALEALVVPRIAELAVRGDAPGLLAAVHRLLMLVGAVAVVTAVGSALIGPALVGLMFGPEYAVSRGTMALLGLGTAVFMLAVAASDVTVALHGHTRMAACWMAGLAAAALSLLVLSDFVLQVTVPLLVGSAVAAALLATAARAQVAELASAT